VHPPAAGFFRSASAGEKVMKRGGRTAWGEKERELDWLQGGEVLQRGNRECLVVSRAWKKILDKNTPEGATASKSGCTAGTSERVTGKKCRHFLGKAFGQNEAPENLPINRKTSDPATKKSAPRAKTGSPIRTQQTKTTLKGGMGRGGDRDQPRGDGGKRKRALEKDALRAVQNRSVELSIRREDL